MNATPLQHVSMTRKNRLIGLAFLCVTIPLMLVSQPAEKKTLVGVWEVKISAGGRATTASTEHCELCRGRQLYYGR
jgi:hypothetical protein